MKLLFAFAGTALLIGCAMTSGHKSGPHGRPVYYIDGMSAGAAYRKAEKLCPHGYEILGDPRQTSVVDYIMTIECNSALGVPPSHAAGSLTATNLARLRIGESTLDEAIELLGSQPKISKVGQSGALGHLWVGGSSFKPKTVMLVFNTDGTFQRIFQISGIDLDPTDRKRLMTDPNTIAAKQQ